MRNGSEEVGRADWSFLEDQPVACGVITQRMEVVYLNEAARSLAAPEWFGSRCWQVFPVEDPSCASSCRVPKAISDATEITYCEEQLRPDAQPSITVGVAVIPWRGEHEDDLHGILLLQARPPGTEAVAFRKQLLGRAREILTVALSRLGERS